MALVVTSHVIHAEGIPYHEVPVDQNRVPWGIPAREIWKQSKLTSYAYTLEQQCYCPLPPKSRVYIVEDNVFAVKDLSTTRWLKETKHFKTINQLFYLIDKNISDEPDSLQIVLDKKLGYPTTVNINPRYRMGDDEINFQISDFMLLKKN